MRTSLAAAFAALLLTLTAGVLAARDTAIAFPADYRSFTHVKSTLVGPQAPGFAANGGYHHFYANALAVEGYRTGTFPDGSILVDDGLEAVERGGIMREGARRRVAVMVKDSKRFSATGNWGFESFPGDSRTGALSTEAKTACQACHQNAGRDLVYSEIRK